MICCQSTHVGKLALGADELCQLANEHALIVVLYPALPIRSSSRDQDLLSIRCHGPIEVLLALYV